MEKNIEVTHQNHSQKKDKKALNINAFVLLFFVIVISAILTYIMPAGEYERVEKDGRTIVTPDSFHLTDSSPVGFLIFFLVFILVWSMVPALFFSF